MLSYNIFYRIVLATADLGSFLCKISNTEEEEQKKTIMRKKWIAKNWEFVHDVLCL